MRSAMNRWVSGLIMRSSSATRYQVGRSFQPGSRDGLLDARDGDRSLNRGEHGVFFGGGVVGECVAKGVGGQPDPSLVVGLEFWCLRMRGIAVEDVGDGFALVGSQGGDVHQGLEARVAGRADDAAGIGVTCEDDWSFGAVDGSFHCLHVVVERGERNGRGDDGCPSLLQVSDDSAPT